MRERPLEQAADEAVDKVAASSGPVPQAVYHYTSFEAFRKISESREIRATSHDCVNDETEIKSADALITAEVETLSRTANGALGQLARLFLERFRELHVTQMLEIYLSCFSLEGDDCQQWREYGDQGRGVSIGVRVLSDERAPKQLGIGSYLARVSYGEEQIGPRVRRAFEMLAEAVSGYTLEEPEDRAQVLSAMFRIAAFIALSSKHSRWSGEHEVRRVTIIDKRAVGRPGTWSDGDKRGIAPASRADGQRIALARIVVGPRFEKSLESIRAVLAGAGYSRDDSEYPAAILSSNCGFRTEKANG